MNLTSHGIETRYVAINAKSDRTPLIMLHGWGGSHQSFLELGQKLAKKLDCPVIIPDLPGFGQSSLPPKNGWNTHDYELWLKDFINQLDLKSLSPTPIGDPPIFYGHSFGCRIILRFLLKHPTWSQKVILTGAAGIKLPLSTKQRFRKLIAQTQVQRLIPKKIRGFFTGNSDWHQADETLKKTLEKVFVEEDIRTELHNIRTKILLIWGANDTYTPLKSGQIFHEKLPNNTFKVFPDGRHGIHYTHTNEILGFVAEFLG